MIPTRCLPVAPADGPVRRFTILCVDDDPAIPKIYERHLKPYGLRVLCACSGQEGYTSALEASPDLILLEYLLPDEDGVQLLARLRAHPGTADVRVLMLTGSDTPAIRRRILFLGVSGVLEKPVDFGELIEQISQFGTLLPVDRSPASHPVGRDFGLILVVKLA